MGIVEPENKSSNDLIREYLNNLTLLIGVESYFGNNDSDGIWYEWALSEVRFKTVNNPRDHSALSLLSSNSDPSTPVVVYTSNMSELSGKYILPFIELHYHLLSSFDAKIEFDSYTASGAGVFPNDSDVDSCHFTDPLSTILFGENGNTGDLLSNLSTFEEAVLIVKDSAGISRFTDEYIEFSDGSVVHFDLSIKQRKSVEYKPVFASDGRLLENEESPVIEYTLGFNTMVTNSVGDNSLAEKSIMTLKDPSSEDINVNMDRVYLLALIFGEALNSIK